MKKSSAKGKWFLILFSLPFAGVGVFMSGLVVKQFTTSRQMRGWDDVPAMIVHAELESHRGDDSTSYKAVARYEYTYEGQRYTGGRVSVHGGSDNVGSFHQRTYRELDGYRKRKEPFACYVNPADPGRSVLYTSLRVEMICFELLFGLLFGGVGFGLMAGGVIAAKRSRKDSKLKHANPEAPWLWKAAWAAGEIRSSNRMMMVFSMVFCLFWNLVSSPLWFVVPAELKKGNRAALVGLLFPAVGIGLLIWVIRSVLRWRKFGESIFRMAEVPGVLGGKLAGVIQTPVHIAPDDGFRLRLTCVNRVTTGSGKHRSTSERILHEDERVMSREVLPDDHTQSAIPVLFALPYDARATDDSNSDSTIAWRLEVKARVPGIDYQSRFEVPVYQTEASSPDFELDDSAVQAYAADIQPGDIMAASGVRLTESSWGGQTYVYPPARHPLNALGLTLFCLGPLIGSTRW